MLSGGHHLVCHVPYQSRLASKGICQPWNPIRLASKLHPCHQDDTRTTHRASPCPSQIPVFAGLPEPAYARHGGSVGTGATVGMESRPMYSAPPGSRASTRPYPSIESRACPSSPAAQAAVSTRNYKYFALSVLGLPVRPHRRAANFSVQFSWYARLLADHHSTRQHRRKPQLRSPPRTPGVPTSSTNQRSP